MADEKATTKRGKRQKSDVLSGVADVAEPIHPPSGRVADKKRETVESAKRKTSPLREKPVADNPDKLRKAELASTVKKQTGQLEAINNVITAATRSPDLNQTLQTALDAALAVIPLEASGISLIDQVAGELVMWAQRGWKHDFTTTPMRVKLGTGLSGLAINSGEVVVTGEVAGDSRLVVPAFAEEEIKAMALAPMRARGKVIGVLSVMSRSPYQFTPGEINTLEVIADQVGLALDNMRLVEALRAGQSRLEAVLDSTADAIIATDDKGRINLVNHAAELLFNIKPEPMLKQPLREVPFLPNRPDIQEKLRLATSASGGEPHRVFDFSTEGGRFLECQVSPVYAQAGLNGGTGSGWVAVFRDITHIKQAELARLQFIQFAAHELRNPLGVTLSALTMLGGGVQNEAEQEIYAIAFRSLNRMQDLIDDMLNLEHIESGVDLRFEPIQVAELIERVATDTRPVLAGKAQTLTLEIAPGLPPFKGDERWLFRALVNLVGNAHKYTPQGTRVTLRARLVQPANGQPADGQPAELVLEVQDDGPGIPADVQPRLFERFFRMRSTEQRVTGTGLGLTIVKSVAEKHAGRAYVQSEGTLPKGSLFGLAMPYRDQEE